jgi:putative ABC transport system permease protein
MQAVEGILVEGLLYSIMALGVFITFRVMDFPDLTVDGSFPFGAAVMAAGLVAQLPAPLCMLLAFIAGVAAGSLTAALHTYLKMHKLLASILTMTILWSINIRVMGNKPNQGLLGLDTTIKWFDSLTVKPIEGLFLNNQNLFGGLFPDSATEYARFALSAGQALSHLLFFLIFIAIVKVLLDLFFRTDMGLTLGAMGNNPQMVISNGGNTTALKFIGLGLSNGLVALCGAMAAQVNGFADIQLGQGIIIAGLASVMIGELIFRSNRIWVLTLQVILGSILYRAVMFAGRQWGFYIGLNPNDLKLITGILIIGTVITSYVLKNSRKPTMNKGGRNA